MRALPLRCLRADDTPQIASIVPAYASPVANAVRNAFEEVQAWTEHLSENASLKARLDAVFGTAGLDASASWCMYPSPRCTLCVSHLFLDDHFSDALTVRTCNGHPLPCSGMNALVCVSEADAASAFEIGDYEHEHEFPYSLPPSILTHARYIWHATQNASTCTSLTLGALSLVWGTDVTSERKRILCGAH